MKSLHAKAYLIGASRTIVTSANLTEQGLTRNHEFGFSAEDTAIAANCHTYFDGLWKLASRDVTLKKLEEWDRKVTAAWVSGAGTKVTPSLGDEGTDVGLPAEKELAPTSLAASSGQGL